MIRNLCWAFVCAFLLIIAVACTSTRRIDGPQVVVEIPAGFSGNFMLELGIKDAPPLPMRDGSYIVSVSKTGKVETSTLLAKPTIVFKNAGDGSVWGLSQSIFNTGDGIPVGGKIEFFVGTRKEFDAEQNKKNHSGWFPTGDDVFAALIG